MWLFLCLCNYAIQIHFRLFCDLEWPVQLNFRCLLYDKDGVICHVINLSFLVWMCQKYAFQTQQVVYTPHLSMFQTSNGYLLSGPGWSLMDGLIVWASFYSLVFFSFSKTPVSLISFSEGEKERMTRNDMQQMPPGTRTRAGVQLLCKSPEANRTNHVMHSFTQGKNRSYWSH